MNHQREERLHQSEAEAHEARRTLIDAGIGVSLIAFDPARERYVFDVPAEPCTTPCDGTGYTGNPRVICTTHYEPCGFGS